MKDLGNFRPQARNANRHTQRGLTMLSDAMAQDGYVAPITCAADGEAIDGSARLERAADQFAGIEPLVIEHDGTRPVVMVRTDIASADEPIARRLARRKLFPAASKISWYNARDISCSDKIGLRHKEAQGHARTHRTDAVPRRAAPAAMSPMLECARRIRPFAGVVWVALLVGVARAIEGPGGMVTGQEDLSPGGIALVGAAAVYAARTIYELVLERRNGNGNGNGKAEAIQQRLLDLYTDHARSEERVLTQITDVISELRDHAIKSGLQAQQHGQQIQALVAQHTAMHGVLGQVQQAIGSCLAQQRGGK